MAGPLLLLGKSLLGSEALSQARPYVPSGLQPFLPRESLAELLSRLPEHLGYMTGLKQEQPSGNLPTDYMVTPTGIVDTGGGQMITGQGVSGFQPRDQYTMDIPYNPATDMFGRDTTFTSTIPDMSRFPTGEIATSPMTTEVSPTAYTSWFNPVMQPDLMEGLPPAIPEGTDLGQFDFNRPEPGFLGEMESEEEEEDFGSPMQLGYVRPEVVSPLRQFSQER